MHHRQNPTEIIYKVLVQNSHAFSPIWGNGSAVIPRPILNEFVISLKGYNNFTHLVLCWVLVDFYVRGPFEKFGDSPYYSESELCEGDTVISLFCESV
jgi:hypothetical protein